MSKSSTLLTTLTLLLNAIAISACGTGNLNDGKSINSFEECSAAGHPIMESFPEQCRTPDGRIFVRDLQEDGTRGRILGMVWLGPTCPVAKNPPDPNCADKPFQTDLVLTTVDQSQVIREFSSDITGRFRLDIQPGSYAIHSAADANLLSYCSTNETIVVRANETKDVIVICDTGIR